MKRSLAALLFLLPMLFSSQSISAKADLGTNHPLISNPNFSIRDNIVRISFDYSNVAGSIQDARITLVVAVPINKRMERLADFHYVLGNWKGFFWSAVDNLKLTSGRITARVNLPWYSGINQNTNITGFGLAVADARRYISNPCFVEGEIIRESWLERLSRIIREIFV